MRVGAKTDEQLENCFLWKLQTSRIGPKRRLESNLLGVHVNGKFGRTVAAAALVASAGSVLFGGTAFATGSEHHNDEGGDGGKGGKNSAKCAAPIGLSVGGLASSGGEVDQCNANGGDGGQGGAGDVDF